MAKKSFHPVNPKLSFPELEERVITYWKEKNIFERSISTRSSKKTWTILDGPPFITGLPHYGSLLSSIPKDLFPRYWTMKGFRVRRVWGWDCHGLPAENKVESKLGLTRKKDIEEKVGIKRFIAECKRYVGEVSGEWEWYVDHVGRWVDFKNAYKTMDLPYMETVMWVFKEMYEKGFIYKGLRVSLYCPHCSTPISNFEVAMDPDNYKSIREPTAVYKYKLKDETNTFLLAWSTTPWNKLATPALAVNPNFFYVKVKQGNEYLILAEKTMKMLLAKTPYKVVERFRGEKLVGRQFIPHYDYYKVQPGKRAFIVVPGEFVTSEEGTGVVTIAAYGEEDLAVMQKENIQLVLHVDEEGILKSEVPKWRGLYYLDVDPLVIDDLKERGLIYRVDPYTHTVPTCWRCHTRLIYAPQDAWYVDIQKLKPKLYKNNEAVHWYPEHFKYGRFLKSVESAPDWCISRSRYWGSPVPVWECPDGHRSVPGSITELESWSGKKINDLHKPDIDELTVQCQTCKKKAKRVPEVLDSWIEAGSASFAERHWPFEKELKRSDFFPPDFIVEYTGQIRAWFYVLHVIATALYDSHAFKNVVVTGVILGTDGRKMSKNFGNYPDPKEMLQKYGGDALRLYLIGSPVMHGEDILISEEQYRNKVKGFLLTLWNVYNFFVSYASVDQWRQKRGRKRNSQSVLDHWILSLLQKLIKEVTAALDAYDTVAVVNLAQKFIDDLSMWYIRRSRDRVGPAATDESEKEAFYTTCFEVLTTVLRVLAPIVPFITEEMYLNLTGESSVHLTPWPKPDESKIDISVLTKMKILREYVESGHAMRKNLGIRLRQPLKSIWLFGQREKEQQRWKGFEQLLKEELNVKLIEYHEYREIADDAEKLQTTCLDNKYKSSALFYLDTELSPELRKEGDIRELIRQIQMLRKKKGCKIDQHISLELPKTFVSYPWELLEIVRRKTLADTITWGDSLQISTG